MSKSLYTWNRFSEGGKLLAKEMGIRRIKHQNSRFKGRSWKTVINWGSSSLPDEISKCRIINRPEIVKLCSDKLRFFQEIDGSDIPIPEWTTRREEAEKWQYDGYLVVARTILNGHSANGLIIVNPEDDLPPAPLYTKYENKKDEFRIHVVRGKMIDAQRKARRLDVADDEVDWKVRNLAGGFIYAREGFSVPEPVREASEALAPLLGLDFGAVDVIWNEHYQKAFVLEVNTAPGLSGTTLKNYANALENI